MFQTTVKLRPHLYRKRMIIRNKLLAKWIKESSDWIIIKIIQNKWEIEMCNQNHLWDLMIMDIILNTKIWIQIQRRSKRIKINNMIILHFLTISNILSNSNSIREQEAHPLKISLNLLFSLWTILQLIDQFKIHTISSHKAIINNYQIIIEIMKINICNIKAFLINLIER